MADKTQFRTIETDEEELNTKIRKHRLKIIKIILLLLALAAVAALGIFFFQKLRKYNSYTVEKAWNVRTLLEASFLHMDMVLSNIVTMGQFIPTPMMKCTGTRPMR